MARIPIVANRGGPVTAQGRISGDPGDPCGHSWRNRGPCRATPLLVLPAAGRPGRANLRGVRSPAPVAGAPGTATGRFRDHRGMVGALLRRGRTRPGSRAEVFRCPGGSAGYGPSPQRRPPAPGLSYWRFARSRAGGRLAPALSRVRPRSRAGPCAFRTVWPAGQRAFAAAAGPPCRPAWSRAPRAALGTRNIRLLP